MISKKYFLATSHKFVELPIYKKIVNSYFSLTVAEMQLFNDLMLSFVSQCLMICHTWYH